MNIELKKKEYFDVLMSDRVDISSNAQPAKRYCICSSPRTGSTLLVKILRASGLAGAPDEYLNPLWIRAWIRNKDVKDEVSISHYLKDIEGRRTTINGQFGIKIHWRHLELLFGTKIADTAVVDLLKGYEKFVLIKRRDKVSQAISDYIARQTNVFQPEHEAWMKEDNQIEFDPVRITETILIMQREEASWVEFLKKNKMNVYEIEFEKLISEYHETITNLFSFLEIPEARIPEIPNSKMKNTVNQEFKERYLHSLGMSL